MRNMNNSQQTIASALKELELSISEADFGGKLKIEGKDCTYGKSSSGQSGQTRYLDKAGL